MKTKVYLSYFDESESRDKNLVVVAALVADERDLRKSEQVLAFLREFSVPADARDAFSEFHTSDLYNGRNAFKGIEHEKAMGIIAQQAWYVGRTNFDLFYAYVDVEKLKNSVFGNAHPVAVAFRACVLKIEGMVASQRPQEMVVPIFDECRQEVRKELLRAFRDLRKPLDVVDGARGSLEHFHDDLYFGDSAYSVGLQMSDLCAFLARRNEEGKENTKDMYTNISHLIRARVDALQVTIQT